MEPYCAYREAYSQTSGFQFYSICCPANLGEEITAYTPRGADDPLRMDGWEQGCRSQEPDGHENHLDWPRASDGSGLGQP